MNDLNELLRQHLRGLGYLICQQLKNVKHRTTIIAQNDPFSFVVIVTASGWPDHGQTIIGDDCGPNEVKLIANTMTYKIDIRDPDSIQQIEKVLKLHLPTPVQEKD